MTSSPAAPYVVEADGGARGNPGPAGYGAVVKDPSGAVIAEVAEAIGTATNNVAEYRGLIAGLTALSAAVGEEAGVPVEVRMDSKLVIEQMSGRWKVKHANIRPLAAQAAALARRYRVTWRWVPREQNAHADRLANEAMDAAARGVAWRSGTPPARSADQGPDRVAAGEEATEAGAGVRAETTRGVLPMAGSAVSAIELRAAADVRIELQRRSDQLVDTLRRRCARARRNAAHPERDHTTEDHRPPTSRAARGVRRETGGWIRVQRSASTTSIRNL